MRMEPKDLIAMTQHHAPSALNASLRPLGLKSTDMGATKSTLLAVGHWDKLSQSKSKGESGLSRPRAILSLSAPLTGSDLLLILASACVQSLRIRASLGIAESKSSAFVVKVRYLCLFRLDTPSRILSLRMRLYSSTYASRQGSVLGKNVLLPISSAGTGSLVIVTWTLVSGLK